ncbi:MAG TPA: hypothetical protein G4O10_09315 [Dehalococcoidia bacterium]|nr:hypothetical protein [Dehalococcoidia bacterium]
MDKLKISRKAWTVAAVCVFLVAAISIGLVYHAKTQQENELETELLDLQQQLSLFQPEEMAAQLEQLENQLAEIESKVGGNLVGSTNAIDSAEELYALAGSYEVDVIDIASQGLADRTLLEVPLIALPLDVKVEGPLFYVVALISALSSEIPTCVVESVQLTVPQDLTWQLQWPNASVKLTIYSYRGE